MDKEVNAKDTRTIKQKIAMFSLIRKLCDEYPIKKIIGHRDISPDLNKNGVIEPFERIKECPCFNAIEEYGRILKKT